MVDVNYMAVIASTVMMMILGALWYSPLLFAETWMKLIGKKKEELAQGNSKAYGITMIGALVESYVMAHIVYYTGATTLAEGLMTGFWIWLGFVATTGLNGVIFEGKPVKLYYINMAYHLVGLLLMGVLFALWQ